MSKQRRKGNAQTASSARAAELLQASGISIPYLGLDALSLTSGLPCDVTDVSALIDDIGANVDPDLRITFKKLTKKDLQTREKAVKELLDTLKESSSDYEKIKNAFPSYASIYSKLVTDSSSSIRSTSNAVLALFITTLKKDAGTYLKSVIPFLFFSLQDGYGQVPKSAEMAVNEICQTEEKKKLAMETFGQETSNLCLQMMSKQHKLIQPQKFVEEESDAQRQTRLIAQSLNTLEAFLEWSPVLSQTIAPSFFTSQSFSSLMNMDTNVKAASFRLLKKLITTDVSPLFGTRIPAFILQHLDANDTLLCRNAFECFLVVANDPKFFETVKVDKAVVPKFLSLVRKKGLHWQVLETSLLPSISIIYDNLADDQKLKWLKSILESFFDGVENGLPLLSWSKAFTEAIKFSFLKAFAREDSKEFQTFLVAKIFEYLDIVIPFKDKTEVVPIVVDLLTWLQIKDIRFDDETKVFEKMLSDKLISMLPASNHIFEPFIEASNDFTIAVQLLKSYECPNSTFLTIFKSIDEDAVDTAQFGTIIARRVQKEFDSATQQQLIKLLWNLIDDGQVKGGLDSFLKVTDPMIARNLIEISNKDLINSLSSASRERITEIALTEFLRGHQSSKLADWLHEAVSTEQAATFIQHAITESMNQLEIKPFLALIKTTSSIEFAASSYKYFFEVLFLIVFKHETAEEEDSEVFKSIADNADCLGKHFDNSWLDFILSKVSDDGFSTKDVVRLAKLLASLSLQIEALNLILPSEAAVRHLINNIGSMFILNIVCEPEKHRLFHACYFGKIKSGPIANLSVTTRFAVFYSTLAYETSKTIGSNDKCVFSKTALYALFTELATEYKAENGMFSTTLSDFQSYHELFIIIDKMLQDSRFDYKDFLESIKESDSRSYLVLLALNDSLKAHGRRHTSFDIIDTPMESENGEAFHMVRVCEEVGRKMIFTEPTYDAALNFIENYITTKREHNETWLFNIDGTNEIRDAASCAMLKLFVTLIENVNLKPKINDFMLCGFVCAMQTVTDSFQTVEGRHYFYSQLAAVYCLQLFHSYDSFIAKRDRNAGLEWNEFYRPAAVGHIMSWVFVLEPSANAGFPQYLINKICLTAQMLTAVEIKEVVIPGEIKNSDEPLGLSWENYDEKTRDLIKFSIKSLFGKSNDTVKFLAVYFLKNLMFDMYAAEKPMPSQGITLPASDDVEDDTMEQQLKEASYQQEKKLPALFEKVLSPESSPDIKVLPKLMVWDSLIHFLSELDVLTRVQYTLQLPVKYTDEILNVLFTLLPKDPEKRLKELSFKGKLTIQHLFAQRFDFRQSYGTTVDHFICNLFFRTLSTLPSIVRNWYTDLPRSRSGEVHDYIRKYLTPLVIARELNSLGNVHKGRLTVKVLAAVNEITAAYRFEDATLSLKISLPDDYPLSKPTIDTQRAIVNKDLLRKWLLQLVLFLSQQNGLMIDGILQWKRNIDNHLEGIEDCTICMMTVSATNYSLPKIKCRQCRKKFHGDCLYKWFDTSNNATCPLCRSPFYY